MTKGKVLLFVFVFLIFIMVVLSMLHCAPLDKCPWERGQQESSTKRVTLTFVGAWDKESDWRKVISEFRQYELANRNLDVRINYEQLDKYNYQTILLDRQLNKKSPNIFMIFNSWLPRYQQRVVEMPESYMTMDQFDRHFPEVAKNDLTLDGKIYSLPMYIDTLGLYYNRDILYNSGYATPPATWKQFAEYVEKLTKEKGDGTFERMGAAIGGSDIVNRSQDIVMLMVMQNNVNAEKSRNPISFRTPEAQRAVKFYTDFADPSNRVYTWNYDDRTYSIDAFTQGRAAMSINYSYEIANLDSKTGGTLKYATAPIPQQYEDRKINYASYWAPVVAKDADCVKESGVTVSCSDIAWDFVSFAAQAQNARFYLEATGRPAANLILASEQAGETESKLAPFASQVFTARSWSNPYNENTDTSLLKMIDSIITTDKAKKQELTKAMSTAVNEIKVLY